MLGTAVRRALDTNGIPNLQLVRRRPAAESQIEWRPASDPAIPDPAPLEGASAAIHLSGANVSAHRWTDSYKREMIASRVDSTRRLATALAGLREPPRVFVVASAIGI